MTRERDAAASGRGIRRIALVLGLAAAFAALPAASGELTLTWAPSADDLTAGYELEVLDLQDNVVDVLDSGTATSVVVDGLEDGRLYRFRVRPYDRFGHKARRASAAIETMAQPSILTVGVESRPDGELGLIVTGINFQQGAILFTAVPGVRVLETQVETHNRLVARVWTDDPGRTIDGRDLLVVNPVRKGPSYLAAHPELFDINGSGTVDPSDIASIEAAFGRTAADSDYLRLLDPNGDGVIDGEDRSHARTALRKERGIPRR